MSRITRVYLNADSRFHEENRAAKGQLKQRAMRVLAQRTKESLLEVNDPTMADAHFDILQQPGSKSWQLHFNRRNNNATE